MLKCFPTISFLPPRAKYPLSNPISALQPRRPTRSLTRPPLQTLKRLLPRPAPHHLRQALLGIRSTRKEYADLHPSGAFESAVVERLAELARCGENDGSGWCRGGGKKRSRCGCGLGGWIDDGASDPAIRLEEVGRRIDEDAVGCLGVCDKEAAKGSAVSAKSAKGTMGEGAAYEPGSARSDSFLRLESVI